MNRSSSARRKSTRLPRRFRELFEAPPKIPKGWIYRACREKSCASFRAFKRTNGAYICVQLNLTEDKWSSEARPFSAKWHDGRNDRVKHMPFIVTDDWAKLLVAVAAEIAQWSLAELKFELEPMGGGYMAQTRYFGKLQVRVTSEEGNLPVSSGQRMIIGIYNNHGLIGQRQCSGLDATRKLLKKLLTFVRQGKDASKFHWDDPDD